MSTVFKRFLNTTKAVSEFHRVSEGKATILLPEKVFYNPVQQFNRDLSIAVIRTWSKLFEKEKQGKKKKDPYEKFSFTLLEALGATGLRSIRYAKEIPNIKHIICNDINLQAVETITRNVEYNGLSLVKPNHADAMELMYSKRGGFDVVDIDPYGTAAPFIDGAVQAVSDGGLICLTCTDLAVLSGAVHPETCFGKYGGMPLRGMFPHEMAIRLVLQSLSVSASRYRRYIVPLVSCSVDFYLRVFLRVYTSPKEVKKTASKTGLFYECSGCHSYHVQPLGKINDVETGPIVNALCEHCHHPHFIGGPAYAGNIHNKDFVANLLEHIDEDYGTYERLRGMLSVIHEETEDAPLYWTLGRLTRVLKCNSMKLRDLYSAIANAGFDVSSSHCDPLSIKTNAPPKVIWDIFRAWIKHHPVVMKNIPEGAPARAILSACNELDVDFTRHHDVYNTVSRMQKLTRYQVNPTAHWGPKPRA